jgi:hypothetical protein
MSLVLSAAVVLALPAASAAALPLSGNSKSFLTSRESVDSRQHLSFYEYLDGTLGISGDGRFTFHFGGWGRFDLAEESYGDTSAGELQYGYLHYSPGRSNAGLRLGRVAVSEGVARYENVDGFHAAADLVRGFSLAAYGGIPVETDDDGRGGDLIYGGRFALQRPGLFELGVSYLAEDNDDLEFREEFGIDSRLRLGSYVEIQGLSGYNAIESTWMEHDYRVALGPFRKLTLIGDAGWTDYDSYFQSPASSVFDTTLFAAEESLLTVGGTVEYALTTSLDMTLAYHSHRYDRAEDANVWGGDISWHAPAAGLSFSFRRVDGSTARLRYSEVRGYGWRRIGKFDLIIDALNDHYDEEVRGVNNAYVLSLALGYDHGERLRLTADVDYGTNPFFESEIKALLKLDYRFSAFSSGREEE